MSQTRRAAIDFEFISKLWNYSEGFDQNEELIDNATKWKF